MDREQWWDSASAQDVAGVWETAKAWQGLDPDAARAADRIREEIRNRYGIDVNTLDADPSAVRDALTQQGMTPEQGDQQRRQAAQEATEAALLLDDADRADREQETDDGEQLEGDGEQVYDSAQRRADLATDLDGVADGEAVQARVKGDTFQGRPASDAVTHSPGRAPRARKGRWDPGAAANNPPGQRAAELVINRVTRWQATVQPATRRRSPRWRRPHWAYRGQSTRSGEEDRLAALGA